MLFRSAPGPQLIPDLTVASVDNAQATTDPQTLQLTGTLAADIENGGTLPVPSGVAVLAFTDVNNNLNFDPGVDVELGRTITANAIGIGASATVQIPVTGQLSFRDAPISVWVDSEQAVNESNEANNVDATTSACAVKPSLGNLVTDPNDPQIGRAHV